jgi:hypothetical protein
MYLLNLVLDLDLDHWLPSLICVVTLDVGVVKLALDGALGVALVVADDLDVSNAVCTDTRLGRAQINIDPHRDTENRRTETK